MRAGSINVEGGLLALPEPDASGVGSFKGVPYAAPPVGLLRWRAPQPVRPWPGVRRSDAFGPNSLQGVVFSDIDLRWRSGFPGGLPLSHRLDAGARRWSGRCL